MKFLSLDERELLVALVQNPDLMKALFKLSDKCASGREDNVLKFNLTPDNFNELAITKARAEGARFLVSDLRQALITLDKTSK